MQVCYIINQLAPGSASTLLFDIIRNTSDPDISFTVCFMNGKYELVSD